MKKFFCICIFISIVFCILYLYFHPAAERVSRKHFLIFKRQLRNWGNSFVVLSSTLIYFSRSTLFPSFMPREIWTHFSKYFPTKQIYLQIYSLTWTHFSEYCPTKLTYLQIYSQPWTHFSKYFPTNQYFYKYFHKHKLVFSQTWSHSSGSTELADPISNKFSR